MEISAVVNPALLFGIVNGLFRKDQRPLDKYIETLEQPEDLSVIMISAIAVSNVLVERVKRFTHQDRLNKSNWAAIHASSKPSNFGISPSQLQWLMDDVEDFMSNIVENIDLGNEYFPSMPVGTEESPVSETELRTFATAMALSVAALIRGLSHSTPRYGSEIDVLNRLVEYFKLIGNKLSEPITFSEIDDDRGATY